MTAPGLAATGRATYAPRRVPEAYVRAEIAAFPLASKEAFDVRLTELDPALGERGWRPVRMDDPERVTDPTARVWRACERSLVEHASGWSLDRIIAVRDRTWFEQDGAARSFTTRGAGPSFPPVPMHRYVRRLAMMHLAVQRGTTDVHVDLNESALEAILRYRWLQFALPEDLLLSALPIDPPPTCVEHENTLMLRGLLDRGVAEIHLHGGAGVPFDMLWTAGLARLADPSLRTSEAIGPDFPIGDTGDEWLRWLLVGAIARIALAGFLTLATTKWRTDLQDLTFKDYLHHTRPEVGVELPGLGRHGHFVLRNAIAALVDADSGLPEFEQLQHIYARLHPYGGARLRPKTADDVWSKCDPVAVRLNLSREGAGERWLLRQAFRYVDERGKCGAPSDPWFETTFWQTIRLRCLCYRHIVQRPLTAGLQWFIRFYERIHELSAPLSSLRPEAILKLAGTEKRLAALEMRVGAGEWATDIADKFLKTLQSWKRVVKRDYGGRFVPPELGVLVHFIKERDNKKAWFQGRPQAFGVGTHADPNPSSVDLRHRLASARTLRFRDFVADNARRAGALAELMHAIPRVLWLLRGIDVANDELGVPTWVLAPLYSYLRQEAAYASALPEARGAPTIRTTAHVGEDYRHLLEGLRRVFEAVVYLLDRKGSRLGHALALGVDPRLWAESVGTVLVPREERLWDLVFEWRLYTRSDIPPELIAEAPSGRISRVAHHIEDLSHYIYGRSDIHAADVACLHHELHNFMLPRRDGARECVDIELNDIAVDAGLQRYCGRSAHCSRARKHLLRQYLSDPGVFQRGQEVIEVPIDSGEVEAMQAVQNTLRCAVAARGIVVEVNPTSNLLIGDMLDLRAHPILRLFPIEPESGPPAVAIALGSDDPVTFSTTLVREYGLLYHAAREAGYPERAVQNWLDLVRQTSLDGRFTLPWRPNVEEFVEELSEELSHYLHIPRDSPPKRQNRGASVR